MMHRRIRPALGGQTSGAVSAIGSRRVEPSFHGLEDMSAWRRTQAVLCVDTLRACWVSGAVQPWLFSLDPSIVGPHVTWPASACGAPLPYSRLGHM